MQSGAPGRARNRWVLGSLALFLGVAIVWVAWAQQTGVLGYRPPSRGAAGEDPTPIGWAWRGAVHVHTQASGDAVGTVGEITAAAKAAGLDFVVVSDHTRAGRVEDPRRPRWVDGILIIFAEETSLDEGHLLVLGTPPHRYTIGPTARQAVNDVRRLGGTPFIAHPVGTRSPWTGGYGAMAGLEIPNLAAAIHRLSNGSSADLLRAAITYPASVPAALLQALAEVPTTLSVWDHITASTATPRPRRFGIVGSVDAHGPQLLGVPTYEQAMAALTTTVWIDRSPADLLADDARLAAARIEAALAEGGAAVVVAAAGTAPGFLFTAAPAGANGVRGVVGPGAAVVATGAEWDFVVDLGAPGNYRIELVRDGEPIAARDGDALHYTTAVPGTYRTQVYRTDGPAGAGRAGNLPWILSNPIYLWPQKSIDEARRFAVPPLPGPPVSESLLAQPGWAAEADELSYSAVGPLPNGLRWQFRIPRAETPGVHAALAWREEGRVDWSAFRGLSLRFVSEREWRVALRVWTRDAAGGQSAWEHVLPVLEGESSTGAIWSSFRRLGSDGEGVVPGQLDADHLQNVVGVAVLVTPLLMRPGTDTVIDVLEFGLFGAPGVPLANPVVATQ